VAGCVAQAAGYAGLLLFVIRAPNNKTEPRWLPVERTLPFAALIFALALIVSYGSLLGYHTETLTRIGIAAGVVVAICAVAILIVRKQDQKPEDYQRLRWMLWGCLIGLPSFLLAELASETTIFEAALGFTPSDDIIGLLYLVNGVLCLFVFEAVRSERVVSVWIPLRRVTILAFILTAPALFLHEQVQRVEEQFTLPDWAWLGLAVFVSFVISLLHDRAVDLADGFFNRGLDRVEHQLGEAIRKSRTAAEIEHVLADEASRALKLTSAASSATKGRSSPAMATARGGTTAERIFGRMSRCSRPWSMARLSGSGVRIPRGSMFRRALAARWLPCPRPIPPVVSPSRSTGPTRRARTSTTTSAPCSPASPMTPPACMRNLRTTSCVRKSWPLRRHERRLGPAPFVRDIGMNRVKTSLRQ
jgi:hypothetical protein